MQVQAACTIGQQYPGIDIRIENTVQVLSSSCMHEESVTITVTATTSLEGHAINAHVETLR